MNPNAANEIEVEKGLGYQKISNEETDKSITSRYRSLAKLKQHEIYDSTLVLPYRRLRLVGMHINRISDIFIASISDSAVL
jgi:hypothetical protein